MTWFSGVMMDENNAQILNELCNVPLPAIMKSTYMVKNARMTPLFKSKNGNGRFKKAPGRVGLPGGL